MEIYQALILGIVQGITELLPISSSAHLNIIPWMFGWINQPGFTEAFNGFDVALHFGTLLAIIMVFFKDWIELIKGGFLLDHFCQDMLNRPIIIAIALMVMGVVLYFVDKNSKNKVKYEEMTLKQTFLIGLSQALAFIPGVSRSGVTITTARAMGVTREAATKYSFLLSTPIVFAATVLKFKDFVFSVPFIIGVLASFLVGLLVINFLLKYIKKGSFKIFAVYRVIFGILIIIVAIIH